jgi:hypothetical protein
MELVNQLEFEADVTDFNIPVAHQEFVKDRIKLLRKMIISPGRKQEKNYNSILTSNAFSNRN